MRRATTNPGWRWLLADLAPGRVPVGQEGCGLMSIPELQVLLKQYQEERHAVRCPGPNCWQHLEVEV